MYLRSELDYEVERNGETLNNFNQMVSARFNGNSVDNVHDISISGAYQWLDENQRLQFFDEPSDSGYLARDIKKQSITF